MGLLDKLWDDTLAGPLPDNGLGKLRKPSAFSFRSNSGKDSDVGRGRSYGDDSTDEAIRVTRSIMIIKPPGNLTVDNGSPPVSPAGSTPPVSPFSGSRGSNRFRRRSMSDAYERRKESGTRILAGPYDA
ncbi:PREDICTED: dormancy-associated protein homolog 3-like [Nelumbo nucifera]|uniref:Dormancy-associated protein homolog 3-like n=1 Tax=Nelumbo nucifera TaxID=4432 RepID=A0A1U8ACQ8_NELNU|nr:PREDICTED: dormancy-associated protein homolog 3-like [Nelumbo nucifera]